jgi:hypothetical protein
MLLQRERELPGKGELVHLACLSLAADTPCCCCCCCCCCYVAAAAAMLLLLLLLLCCCCCCCCYVAAAAAAMLLLLLLLLQRELELPGEGELDTGLLQLCSAVQGCC